MSETILRVTVTAMSLVARSAIVGLVLAGCATAPPAHSDDDTQLPPGPIEMAPTPYTAEQIRKATVVGRTYDYEVEETGEPTTHLVMSFTRVKDTDADVARVHLDTHGVPVEPGSSSLVTWEELRRHAEFPRSLVEIADEQITVPVGTFDCLRYTLTVKQGPDKDVLRFYFAKNLPGAPVLWYAERNGKRVRTSTLVRYLPGG